MAENLLLYNMKLY